MAFTLPELPWAKDSLSPVISVETVEFHYGKHHNGYLGKLNAAVEGTDLASKSLEDVVKASKGKPAIFNNAAQVWNHTFYWNSLKPGGGGNPTGKVGELINSSFGSFDKFKDEFTKAAAGQFGSGWAWLVQDGGKLAIATTGNADTPLADGKKCILTLDVWEHAYYIDYRNDRPKYINGFWSIVNWDFANKNLG